MERPSYAWRKSPSVTIGLAGPAAGLAIGGENFASDVYQIPVDVL
jgi:hypothetical protein